MAFEEQLPEWENEGTQPPQSKRVEGWLPNEKPPASWFNWLFGRTYRVLKELQEKAALNTDLNALDQRQTNHENNKNNPHGVTKEQVGLGNVDNVKQASKSEFDAHKADGVHGRVEATNTDDATSIVNAPLKSAGGLAVAKRIVVGEGIVLNRTVDLPLPIPSPGSIIHYSFSLPDTDWTTVVDVGSNTWAMQLTGLIGGADRRSVRGFSLIYGRGGSDNDDPYLILLEGSEEFIRLDGSALQFRSRWDGYGLDCRVFLSRIL